MDIYCPRCGEPCDLDELHETELSFYDAKDRFYAEGCGVLFSGRPCQERRTAQGSASAALAGLLGDDVDGIASLLDDFGY